MFVKEKRVGFEGVICTLGVQPGTAAGALPGMALAAIGRVFNNQFANGIRNNQAGRQHFVINAGVSP